MAFSTALRLFRSACLMTPAADGGCLASPTCAGGPSLATLMALPPGAPLTQLAETAFGERPW
eukprot:8918565-Alexandrium_andersonii.AAC.1